MPNSFWPKFKSPARNFKIQVQINRGWDRKFIAVLITTNMLSEWINILNRFISLDLLLAFCKAEYFFPPVAADNQISMHWMVAFWLRDSYPGSPGMPSAWMPGRACYWPSLARACWHICLAWPARSIIGIYRERIFPLFSSKPIKMFMQYDDVGVLKSWTGQKGKWGLHHLSSEQNYCI